MKKKLTPWERRNLGVESSIEFLLEQGDVWIDVVDELNSHFETYQVMHIPEGNTDVLLNAPSIGFLPIEVNIQLTRKLDLIELPQLYKRFESAISFNVASKDEQRRILNAIREGNIFTTDKVARDPYFGSKSAGLRYVYWTQDVIDQGATLLCMKYKGRMVAFDVCVDQGDGVAEAFLGGILPEYKNSGLGFLTVYFITKYAMDKGYKKIITGVSSNNIPILKIHELFGYSVESMSYCLIRHM